MIEFRNMYHIFLSGENHPMASPASARREGLLLTKKPAFRVGALVNSLENQKPLVDAVMEL
uniref:SFRICE_011182 n=1 Tax=Spodoptera frugiperda TaxID=7108 RepID=A0A2H1X345_SPOFR